MHEYHLEDLISSIEFSADSHYILITMKRKGVSVVKSILDEDWNCRIDEVIS
jgi:hypothetical protein